MKKHLQNTLFSVSIFLILSSLVSVNADPLKLPTSEIEYQRYPEGRKYRRFFPSPIPEGLSGDALLKATANIDDTPEKETVVLMLVEQRENYPFDGNWHQAFLLITDENANGEAKKKAFFKLFDSGVYDLEVPATPIDLQSPLFVFTEPPKNAIKSRYAAFKLVDLTGDGTLDIWVEFGYAVAVISFQDGEFKEIFSTYTVPGMLPDAEYVDLDKDGTYEIKIPYSIQIEDLLGAPYLPWVSLYEWNGSAYVLDNERFYADNDEFLIRLLSDYNYQLLRYGTIINLCETYRFYLGLVSYYRGNKSPSDLEWILKHAKNKDYIQVASSLLKRLPPPRR